MAIIKGDNIVVDGNVSIDNTIKLPPVKPVPVKTEEAVEAKENKEAASVQLHNTQAAQQATQLLNVAKAQAESILQSAKTRSVELLAQSQAEAEQQAAEILEQAKKEGFQQGKEAGYQEGFEKGYADGISKCKDTLLELKSVLESVAVEKRDLFLKYESQIFATIFDIANKITLDSLKQKDKAVLQNMVKAAGAQFRNSDYIKITLSKQDLSEDVQTDLSLLRSLFKENQHIEFEVLREAPSGTLILDNGSEITDAGVSTQLKMIRELGMGKFRDAEAEQPDVVGEPI